MRTEKTGMHVADATPFVDYEGVFTSKVEDYDVLPAVAQTLHPPSFELLTGVHRGLDQFAAWRQSFAPMLELSVIDDEPAEFYGKQRLWDLGNLVFAQISTDRLAFTSLPGHVRRDPLDHWTMTMLQSGTLKSSTSKRTVKAGAGEIVVHSLGREFIGEVSKSDMLMLFVPRDFSDETTVALSSAELSALDTGMGRLLSDYLTGVANRLPMISQADVPGLSAATRAMILACVSPDPDTIEAADEPITTVLLERARKFVQKKLLDPALNSEAVRRELGISRTRLYNLFEPFGGVMRYIQYRRLLDAHSVLADPDDHRLILDIAEQHGFSDGAEFSRAFKRAFGYSPSEVRRGGRSSAPGYFQKQHELCPDEARLGMLLRRLQG